MGSRQRRQGHKLEVDITKFYARVFNIIPFNGKNHRVAQVGSTRQFSATEDAAGKDIFFAEGLPTWVRSIVAQCKKKLVRGKGTKSIDVQALLDLEGEDQIHVLHTRITVPAGSRERKLEDVVTLKLKDFQTLIQAYDRHKHSLHHNGAHQKVSRRRKRKSKSS